MTNIPTNVRRFVAEHIPSVERLEVLLLLYHSHPKPWTVAELEESLRTTPESIRKHLSALSKHGLTLNTGESTASFAYLPREDHDDAVKKLAGIYRIRRVTVIELIYSQQQSERVS